MQTIFETIEKVAIKIDHAIKTEDLGYSDTENTSGEDQLKLDVKSDYINPSEIAQQIRASKTTNGGVAEDYITNIFNIQSSLITESLVAKSCVEFLVRSFNRPFVFSGTAIEIAKAKEKFDELCFDSVFKMQLLTECAAHGGI